MVPARDPADPRGLAGDFHQRFAAVGRVVATAHLVQIERPGQVQVGGERDAAEKRRHMRHEFDRVAELARHFALVHVAGERIRHQVVVQLVRVVLVGGAGAGAGITRNAETLHRPRQRVGHGLDRDLHRRGVTARVADAAFAPGVGAGELRQAVVPALVEAVVGRQVDHHGVRGLRIQRRDKRRRHAVGQGQHQRIGALPGCRFGVEVHIAQVAGVGGLVLGQALAGPFARRDEGELEARVRRHQPDQLGADVAARAHQAQGNLFAHAEAPCSSLKSRLRRTIGHSLSRME